MVSYLTIFCLLPILLSCNWDKTNPDTKMPFSFSGQVRLIEAKCCPPGCGVIAWANAQKFEVIKSDISLLNGKTIILIEKCADVLGKDFLRQDRYIMSKPLTKGTVRIW